MKKRVVAVNAETPQIPPHLDTALRAAMQVNPAKAPKSNKTLPKNRKKTAQKKRK